MPLSNFQKRVRWIPDDWPMWVPMWASDLWQKALCALWGHLPIPDQCGMPEHDYCGFCLKSMPGEGRP